MSFRRKAAGVVRGPITEGSQRGQSWFIDIYDISNICSRLSCHSALPANRYRVRRISDQVTRESLNLRIGGCVLGSNWGRLKLRAWAGQRSESHSRVCETAHRQMEEDARRWCLRR
jgi:hypothetical protein